MTFRFFCCCPDGGNFDWYQWDLAGQPAQDYIAMFTAVQPAASTLDWIDFNSHTADVDNPAWKIDTAQIWQLDYGDNDNNGMFFTLAQIVDNYEAVFFAYEWWNSTDSRLEVNIGLVNASSEMMEWEKTRSIATDFIWPSAPAAYGRSTFLEVVHTAPWGNLASSSYGQSTIVYDENNETAPFVTVFSAGYSPAEIERAIQPDPVAVPNPYRGNATISKVAVNSIETIAEKQVAFVDFNERLYLGGSRYTYPYYNGTTAGTLPHDSTVTYDDTDDEIACAGSRMAQAWAALEYPGALVDYGDTYVSFLGENVPNKHEAFFWDYTKYQSFMTACNNAEAVNRIVHLPPRGWPFAFGVKHPKAKFVDNEVASTHYPADSTPPWPLYHLESFTENVEIVWGEINCPTYPADEPMYIPSGTRVYHNEKTQNRLAADGITDKEDGDNVQFLPTVIAPMSVWAAVKYGDCNEEGATPGEGQWGCIFVESERDISAWVNGLEGASEDWYEIISDERVFIHVRINSETDVRKFRCYREDDTNRMWDMIAIPQIEPDQNLTGRHFMWLEQLYTGTQPENISDPATIPTKGKVEIRRCKVGESISDVLWQTSVNVNASAVTRPPHIRHCSDRYYYLLDFQAVWPTSKGGDDGTYYYWVCSHEREEIVGSPGTYQPAIFYPWQDPITRPAHIAPEDHWWQTATWNGWGNGPYIDSVKYSDNNRIAPLLEVRTP